MHKSFLEILSIGNYKVLTQNSKNVDSIVALNSFKLKPYYVIYNNNMNNFNSIVILNQNIYSHIHYTHNWHLDTQHPKPKEKNYLL